MELRHADRIAAARHGLDRALPCVLEPRMEPPGVRAERLGPLLAREHAAWLDEVRRELGPAQAGTAGPWTRWHAIRYLEGAFVSRVNRERRLVDAVAGDLSDADQAQLWALGELLDVLPAYLAHLVGLCHRAGDFADVTARITAALGRWCKVSERAVGPLALESVPAAIQHSFGWTTLEAVGA